MSPTYTRAWSPTDASAPNGPSIGIPTAVIVTTEFVHESKMQSLALGMDDLAPVVIAHPLSALTSDLIIRRAEQAAPQAEAIWLGKASAGTA